MMLSQNTGSNAHGSQDNPGKRHLGQLKSMVFLTILYLLLLREMLREHMLIKELESLSSGFIGFNFIFMEKNNSTLL